MKHTPEGAVSVQVQIVNYRTLSLTRRLLGQLVAEEAPNIRVSYAILDNGSGDDISELDQCAGNVLTFSEPKNVGFGAGHNFMASCSTDDYLWLLNPDCFIIDTNPLQSLLEVARRRRAGAVGPSLRNVEGKLQAWDHGELRGFRAHLAASVGSSYWKQRNQSARVAWVNGASILLNRSAFESVGGFDEKFFMYKEEEDLCLRLRRRGWCVWYEPSLALGHLEGVGGARAAWQGPSNEYFARKHGVHPEDRPWAARLHRRITERTDLRAERLRWLHGRDDV